MIPTYHPFLESYIVLHFPTQLLSETSQPSHTMHPQSNSRQLQPHILLPVCTLLGDGRHGRVWQGTVSASRMVIAVKTLENKEIALREAKFYEQSPEAISHLIPKYFGTYARPDESWFAIVMEDVGICLEKELGIGWYEIRRKLGLKAW